MVRILAIGAHPDDIELGCFGMLASRKSDVHILVVTNGDVGGDTLKRVSEAQASASIIDAKIYFGGLVDTKISDGPETINLIERYIKEIKPDVVFVNSPHDTHQDHRNLARAVVSATRYGPNKVYFYETPTSTQDFHPSVYYDITDVIDIKCRAVACHNTQNNKPYMSEDTIKGLSKYRAVKINMFSRYVEPYEPHKVILNLETELGTPRYTDQWGPIF